MTLRQTLLYIGATDENYHRLCYVTKDAGYTIIQLRDCNVAMNMAKSLDVFIIIINQGEDSQICSAEDMEAITDYCVSHQITLVEIQSSLISVIQNLYP